MARLSPQQWLDKWGRRLSAAGPDIAAGVDRVQTAPGVSAAAAADRMLLGVSQSIQDGTWQKNVSKVPLADWKNAMKTKGVQRLQQGITQAQSTKQANVQALLNAVDAAKSVVDAMPKGGLEQNIARSVAFQREMAARAPKRNQ